MQGIFQVYQVAKHSFIEWILDIRQIVILIVLMCVSNYTVLPLVRLSTDKQAPMNIAEPFLANINSIYIILIILISWLVLISDTPKMEGNNGYILIRITRLTWLFGKILSIMASAIFFLTELFLIFTIRTVGVCYIANGWSNLMKDFTEKYLEESTEYAIVCTVNANIYNHYTPFAALGKTLLLLFFLMCMFGFIMMAASLSKSKFNGVVINIFLTISGFAVIQSGSTVSCYLPIGNVMLSVQATTLIWIVPKWYSICYFLIILFLLMGLNLLLIRRGQVQKDGER